MRFSAPQHCTYCGEFAQTVDHIPPKTAREDIITLGMKGEYPFLEVPACYECNSALGARGLWTLKERTRFVKAWLRKRYSKVLAMPEWEPEELLALGPNLRESISQDISTRRRIKRRIRWHISVSD